MKYQKLISIAFVALLMILSATITCADIMEGLVAYWSMDDGAGTVAHDLSENGNDGNLENGPKWVPSGEAKMGKGALSFDGSDDRIIVESFDIVDGTGITLAAWINPASFDGDDARIISKAQGGGTGDHYWAVVLSGNGEDDLQFRLRTDAGSTSKITVPDGQEIETNIWTHVAVTWDANDPNMRFYKNGEEIHIAGKPGAAVGVGPDVKIGVGNQSISAGADSMDRPFHGVLDDVAIWNRGLTQPEIAELMANGIPAAVEPSGKLAITWGAVK